MLLKLILVACALLMLPVEAEVVCDSLSSGWRVSPDSEIISSPATYAKIRNRSGKNRNGIAKNFNSNLMSGKEITLSVEVKKDIQPSGLKFKGGKAVFSWLDNKRVCYGGVPFGEGTEDWKTYSSSFFIPVGAEKINISIYIQEAEGSMHIRNLKIEAGDAVLPVAEKANMGFADAVANDGQGGWTDQGPENDAASFNYKQHAFGGVPFYIADPVHHNGKAIVAFGTKVFSGPDKIEFDYPVSSDNFNYLYLLHSSTHNSHPLKPVGFVDLVAEDGTATSFEIRSGRDVANWWNPKRLANACPVALWKNRSCGSVGAYLSKFRLPQDVKVKRIHFRTGDAGNNWLLLAATLSVKDYPFPKEKENITINASQRWRPLKQNPGTRLSAGSALDLSWLTGTAPVGSRGRVIINDNGELAFEKEPKTAVRFMGHNWLMMYAMPYLKSKAEVDEYADQIKRAGYNMVRTHFLTAYLMIGMEGKGSFHPQTFDTFDYFVFALKKRGIYLCWDVMCARAALPAKPGDPLFNKLKIHFDQASRNSFATVTKAFLNHYNPYTKMTLAEDPVFALAVAYNEQEFAFLSYQDQSSIAWPRWREFLKKRYHSIEALKQEWGKEAEGIEDFESIQTSFGRRSKGENISPTGKDVARFISACEIEFYAWAKAVLREAGYKGAIANYNMDKALRYGIVRDGNDYIAINSYHAHPMKDMIDPGSSIASQARIIREFVSTKRYGKPLVVTEHAHGFWNRYRYEQGLLMGGYACFQNFAGLVNHSHPITLAPKEGIIRTFWTSTDPVIRASEFLTALLFIRRDVKTAPAQVRVVLDPPKIYANGSSGDGLNPQECSLAFVTGFSTEVQNSNEVLKKNQVFLPAYSGAPIVTKAINGIGVRQILDSDSLHFSMDKEIAKLKKSGQLPPNNRSAYRKKLLFETSTGEIVMDVKNESLYLDTPCTQGICAKAGTQVALRDFEILSMTTRGSLAATSIDGNKSLKDANRIMVVYITNAVNSGIVFGDDTYRQMLKPGTPPVLWETGTFKIRLKNINASAMKCYALKDTGERREELPLHVSGNQLDLAVDTAALKDAPAIYFELSSE
jgi:hypothetical protein